MVPSLATNAAMLDFDGLILGMSLLPDLSLTVLHAGTAAKVQIKICICGNNPCGRAPFFQSKWSLDTAFDFLS